MATAALRGVRVVEFAGLAPGPLAGLLLADFGADVVRVDRYSAEFETDWMSRGKRSIAVDLKHSQGVEIVRRLVSKADVVIDPYRPGTLDKLSLGFKQLSVSHPRLIYAAITGYGQSGPLSHRAGHDLNYIAACGVLSACGRAGQPPTPPGNLLADFAGGSFSAVIGILMALFQRERTGKGQLVDASMTEGAAYAATFINAARAMGMWNQPRGQNLLDTGAPFYDTYATKDGQYMAVAAIEANFYKNLLKGLQLSASDLPPPRDPRKWPELRQKLTDTFLRKTRTEWEEVFGELDACVTPVLSFDEYVSHPHTIARHGTRTVETRNGPCVFPSPAPRLLSATESEHVDDADVKCDVRVGEHTNDILCELGYSESEADAFITSGAAQQYAPTTQG